MSVSPDPGRRRMASLGHFKSGDVSLGDEDCQKLKNFFSLFKCYDLMPTSTKLIVLDNRLNVKKAFNAMVDTGVRACVLWDNKEKKYVGMLTITDFIRILKKNYTGSGETMHAFEEQRLKDVKGIRPEESQPDLQFMQENEPGGEMKYVSAESSLLEATSTFLAKKIHRLPIVDVASGNVLFILTQKLILKYTLSYFPNIKLVNFLHRSIKEAEVGTFGDIKIGTMDMTIIQALNVFVEEKVSALPIVDEEGRLIHIYSKFDVINLAAEKTYAYLDAPLKDAIKHKNPWFGGVYSCKAHHTVLQVMEGLVKREVSRLVVTDQQEKVIGVVTIADILFYLIYFDTGESRKSSQSNLSFNFSNVSLFDSSPRTRSYSASQYKIGSSCEYTNFLGNWIRNKKSAERISPVKQMTPAGETTMLRPSKVQYVQARRKKSRSETSIDNIQHLINQHQSDRHGQHNTSELSFKDIFGGKPAVVGEQAAKKGEDDIHVVDSAIDVAAVESIGEIEKPIIKKGAVTDMVVNKSFETEVEHEKMKTEGSNEKVKANIAGKLASSQEKMSHGQFRS